MTEKLTKQSDRYQGFTCPNCGSHNFGTHTHRVLFMGKKYPEGTKVGKCHENQHTGNGCQFEWNRNDPVVEDQCMYQQTSSSWNLQ